MRNLDGFYQYEFVVFESLGIIKVPRLSSMFMMMKRSHYFIKEYGYQYDVHILSPEDWERLKKNNEVKIFKTKERK